MLIDAGADVTTEARGKHQPIHLAAKVGDVNIIKLLLNKGAQVDAKTKVSKPPDFKCKIF